MIWENVIDVHSFSCVRHLFGQKETNGFDVVVKGLERLLKRLHEDDKQDRVDKPIEEADVFHQIGSQLHPAESTIALFGVVEVEQVKLEAVRRQCEYHPRHPQNNEGHCQRLSSSVHSEQILGSHTLNNQKTNLSYSKKSILPEWLIFMKS